MFNKRGEVVDFTIAEKLKKKRGLHHAAHSAPSAAQTTPSVGGFLDFTSPAPQSSNTASTETSGTFGFLSDFASSASIGTNTNDVTSKLTNPDAEVNALKLKIDDLEYKLERMLERLSEMETKIVRA